MPSLREYAPLYQIDAERLRPRQLVMHPGPVNRGVELRRGGRRRRTLITAAGRERPGGADGDPLPHHRRRDERDGGEEALRHEHARSGQAAARPPTCVIARRAASSTRRPGSTASRRRRREGAIARARRQAARGAEGRRGRRRRAACVAAARLRRPARAPARARARGRGGPRAARAAAAAGGFWPSSRWRTPTRWSTRAPVLRACASARRARGARPVGFLAAVTRGLRGEQLTEMAELREAGAVGFTDDGLPLASARLLRRALQYQRRPAASSPLHEEDPVALGGGRRCTRARSRRGSASPASRRSPRVDDVARDLALAAYEDAPHPRLPRQRRASRSRHLARAKAAGVRGHRRGHAAPPDPDRRGGRLRSTPTSR